MAFSRGSISGSDALPTPQPPRVWKDLMYAETKDEDYDTDLNEKEENKEEFDRTGRKNYQQLCRLCELTPVSYFLRHLPDDSVNLAHHGIGPNSTKALGLTLMNNTNVLNLNLSHNNLGVEGVGYICKMMKENCYITELNLSYNNICALGGLLVFDMMEMNTTLKVIDISGNQIPDQVAMDLSRAVVENYVIESLNVSHNHLGSRTLDELSNGIVYNDTLKELNLSWNNFRQPSINKFITALTKSSHVKYLDLSFSGIGNEGGIPIGNFLKTNLNLIHLNLGNCRIFSVGCLFIAKGLELSSVLQVLKLNNNPIGPEGARALVEAMAADASVMEHLDVTGVDVDKHFIAVKDALLQKRKVTILHATVIGDYTLKSKCLLFNVLLTDVNENNFFQLMQQYSQEEGNANIVEAVITGDKKKCGKMTVAEIISSIGRVLDIRRRHIKYLNAILAKLENSSQLVDIKCIIPPEPKS